MDDGHYVVAQDSYEITLPVISKYASIPLSSVQAVIVLSLGAHIVDTLLQHVPVDVCETMHVNNALSCTTSASST